MATPLEIQLILCDAAQADPASGKVHMLGAGWSRIFSPMTHAVVVLAKVPWDRADQRFSLTLTLRDQDGEPVRIATHDGPRGVHSKGAIRANRPGKVPSGDPIDASFALNVSPLPLAPGHYDWHLEIAGETRTTRFTVLAPLQ
ncbi:hypothetical protein GCM10010435_43300 [Winogradskya consettensis]|uniref:Uncharacterized protein n=1 Tax=Winogradskya consettensis TaxID=113560 RepID=A0A919T1G5_9ACTN|nr:hypothetical protein [Actinoplanes consettensis]GIM83447.1 hypothetical protein Aco04nite_86560 [Actinoplanes consettensis]